ncbi:MAG: WD40 repeat domain-containing protein [Planctomycetota bacterium]
MGTGYVSSCLDMVIATGARRVYIWQWKNINNSPKEISIDTSWMPLWKDRAGPHPPNRSYTAIYSGCIAYALHRKDDTFILLRDIGTDRLVKEWALGKRWEIAALRSSRNGRFIALHIPEVYRLVVKDHGRTDEGRHRLGVIDGESQQIELVSTIYHHSVTLPRINAVAVSEDGNYLVAVGTNSGGFIHLADVTKETVLWEKVPRGQDVPIGQWTVNFNDVCFSPDNKYIYVAGNVGLLCFDLSSGKIVSQWLIPGRCIGVAASPDGRLVAGGGGGNGLVFVYQANTGRELLKLDTGQFTIYGLAFSPDSKMLATAGVMNTNVKIFSGGKG